MGADLSDARHQRHYFSFKEREKADAAARELESEGYAVSVVEVPETREWLTVAERSAVISETVLEQLRPRLNALAEMFEGRYTGWEAAAKP